MTTEFPKLMWLKNGLEITVYTQAGQEEMLAQGASLTNAPAAEPVLAMHLEPEPVPETEQSSEEPEHSDYDSASLGAEPPKKKRGKK